MAKKPVSLTIDTANLTWLRGRVMGEKQRSLSQALDDVVTAARLGGLSGEVRSVVGTIDIAGSDAGLDDADRSVQALYDASVARPFLIRDAPMRGASASDGRKRRRG